MTGASHPRMARLAALAALLCGCGGGGGSEPPPAPAPALRLSASTASFSGRSFRAELPAQTIAVTNGGGGTLAPPELSVTYGDGAGWLAASVAGTSPPYTITLEPTSERLSAGTHAASVQVASAGASDGPQTISVTVTLGPTWTVFVYGHADGERPTAFLRDLQEMGEAALGDAVTLIVAADLSAGRVMPGGGTFPQGTEWLRIPGSGAQAVLLGTFAEQDFDDPAVLGAAAAAAFSEYPADRLAVVLWGRGASWRGFGGDEHDTPDPADDGAGLGGAAIAQALSGALVEAGHAEPLAFVAFDASAMMGQEVAYELREVASVLVASAGVELGAGLDYAASLGRLGAEPAIPPLAFAAAEVQDWEAHHAGPADLLVRAHAALDLTRLGAYAADWGALASALTAPPDPLDPLDPLVLARTLHRASPGYGAGDPTDPDPASTLRDAGQFLDALALLEGEPAAVVAAAAGAARASLDALLVSSSLGSVRSAAAQAGVHFEGTLGSSWVPAGPYDLLLGWHAATGWGDVLQTLAGQDAQQLPPVFTVTALNTTDPTLSNPPRIEVSSGDADVAGARIYLAKDEGVNVLSRGVIADLLLTPDVKAEPIWDGNLPALSNGGTSADVFVRPWIGPASSCAPPSCTSPASGSGAVFLLPGKIGDDAGSIDAHAVLVGGDPIVNAVAVGVNGSLAVLPLSDFGGLRFTPLLWNETEGWEASTALTIPSEPDASFTFQPRSALAGAYRLRTRVQDLWGNAAEVSHDVTVGVPFGTGP